MPYELKNLKEIRRKFGLTQWALAKRADVSQSLIAKVEAGILDPTYSNAKKIFAALELLTKGKEVKAEEIMNKKIVSIAPSVDMHEAIKKMKKYEISQLPVIEHNDLVGMISETIILDALLNAKKEITVGEIMQDAPPIISRKTSFNVISSLLKVYPLLVVAEKGKLQGVITKSDLIRRAYK
jgi:predicted transcriptional regulator